MSDAPLFDKHDITHIRGVAHPESIGIGPGGEAYTTGTGCQVYRLNLEDNVGEQFASTEARCLGTAVDADGNLWVAFCHGGCVTCFDARTGEQLRKVDFPCVETTACAFGGSNLDRLFVTTGLHKTLEEPEAGRGFVIDGLGVQGTPAFAFAE